MQPDLYALLHAEAERQGQLPERVARKWLAERLVPLTAALPGEEANPPRDRERVRAALRAAGVLVESTPEQLAWAGTVDVALEEVREALDRASGKPLSEIVIEQ